MIVIVFDGGGEGGRSRDVSSISVWGDSSVGFSTGEEVVGDGGGGWSRVFRSISVCADSVGFTADGEVVGDGAFCTSTMCEDVTVRALTGMWTVGCPSPPPCIQQSVM